MTFTIDANLLIYETNVDAPEHEATREALAGAWSGSEPVVLFAPAVLAYLRNVTHRTLPSRPVSVRQAFASIDQVLALDHVRFASDTSDGWSILRDVALRHDTYGVAVHDAHLVALMRQHGVDTIWTHDVDFRRFDGIRVYDPVTGYRGG